MDIWSAIARARESGTPAVVVTVVATRGSVPADPGSKLLMTTDGLVAGTVGGGKIEAHVLQTAREMLASSPTTRQETWNLQRDIGMTCGGEMSFLFETLAGSSAWPIILFGAGHVVQALVPILATLRTSLTVIDTREDWLARLPAFHNLRKIPVSHFEDGLSYVTPSSFVLSITKGHATDRPVLREVGKTFPGIPFIGVIGSASKKAVLFRELRGDGLPDSFLNRIECPLGLPIGNNDPAEIAISIAARLLQARDESPASLPPEP